MNPAQPVAGVQLCPLTELEDPGGKGFTFRLDEKMFRGVVVRVGDNVYGYLDRCPHAGFPLGNISGDFLTREKDMILCRAHFATFRPEDGMCVAGPCEGRGLIPWAVRLEDGMVVTA